MVEERKKEFRDSNESLIMGKWINDKTPLAIHLINGKSLSGILLWRDAYNLGVRFTNGKEVFLPKHSVLYIEPL